jgi:hypothetical protein
MMFALVADFCQQKLDEPAQPGIDVHGLENALSFHSAARDGAGHQVIMTLFSLLGRLQKSGDLVIVEPL